MFTGFQKKTCVATISGQYVLRLRVFIFRAKDVSERLRIKLTLSNLFFIDQSSLLLLVWKSDSQSSKTREHQLCKCIVMSLRMTNWFPSRTGACNCKTKTRNKFTEKKWLTEFDRSRFFAFLGGGASSVSMTSSACPATSVRHSCIEDCHSCKKGSDIQDYSTSDEQNIL